MVWLILPICLVIILRLLFKKVRLDIIHVVLVCLASYVAGIIIYESMPKGLYKSDEYTIVSIDYFQGMKGKFLLGTGNTNGNLVYIAYRKNNDHFQLVQIPADKAIIMEDSTYHGSVEIYKKKPRFPRWKVIAIGQPRIGLYIIHVPKNVIMKQFIL